MNTPLSRRALLAGAGAFGVGLAMPASAAAPRADEPFKYCLNTSTIRGQKLSFSDEIEIAAKAGFQAMEPWISELDASVKAGVALKDLGKKLSDSGITIESAIGFAPWIVDDDEKRKAGVEQMKREMDMVAQLGGKRIAAPPAGAHDKPGLDLNKAAERYRAILEIGDQTGVVPEMEFWGPAKSVSTLAEAAYIALRAGHPKACLLPDIYHLHRGGSGYEGLKMLSGDAIHVIHTNDYPAEPPREALNDGHRLYPGDGGAPLNAIFKTLKAIGFRGSLSVELFNKEYWKQDALLVAKTAIEKTREAVKKALA